LYESLDGRHGRVRLMPHGVDWGPFHDGTGRASASLLALPAPRVGLTGLLDERVDVELLHAVAEAMPDVTFVLVGERRLRSGPLDRRANVHFLDRVAYEDVPATMH